MKNKAGQEIKASVKTVHLLKVINHLNIYLLKRERSHEI